MIEALILGVVQGITEFLPVSSSGHLLLLHDVFGLDEGGLAFDVALHIGTLVAVMVYFWNDISGLLRGVIARNVQDTHLAIALAVATIPAVIFGLLFQEVVETVLRSPWVVVFMLVIFGLFMIAAELKADDIKKKLPLEKLDLKQSVIIGCLQACALIPGVSRSGATISGGLLLGLDRVKATRFSFLLAIPIILGAGVKVLAEESVRADIAANTSVFVIGMLVACISGLVAISFLLKFVARYSIRSFAYYRFAVAAIIAIILLA